MVTEELTIEELTAQWAKGEDRSNFQQGGQSWGTNDFAIMKATENCAPHAYSDPTFPGNWAEAKKQGKPRGAYHFFHPWSSPRDQAHFFVETARAQGLDKGDFLVADVEITSGTGDWRAASTGFGAEFPLLRSHLLTATAGSGLVTMQGRPLADFGYGAPANRQSVGNAARAFLDIVATLVSGDGVTVWVYTNLAVGADLGSCTMYPLWIAYPSPRPPASVSPWTDWHMWQYAFGGGQGGGDRDEYHGTLDEMKKFLGIEDNPPPPPPPPPNWEEEMMAKIPDPVCQKGDNDHQTGHRWVRRVQGLLLANGGSLILDGIYGDATTQAVANFQQACGAHVHGQSVDPNTYSLLVTGQNL
jgi:GH25 family lysozyme M1 (1,4-beta-N-acetylmuramidase)